MCKGNTGVPIIRDGVEKHRQSVGERLTRDFWEGDLEGELKKSEKE